MRNIDPNTVDPVPDTISDTTSNKTIYSGTDVVGRTSEVRQDIESDASISRTYGGVIGQDSVIIKKWLGIVTRPPRGNSPLGALSSVKNLRFNKTTDSMSLRDGTSSYASSYVDLSNQITLIAINKFFALSTETPTAQNIDIICGTDGSANKHIFQKKFWEGNGAGLSPGIKYVKWGETKTGTIASTTTNTIVFSDATGTASYYRGWIVRNSTHAGILYVSDSSTTGGNTTLTVVGNVPSNWVGTDSITLYRCFHDNYSFSPTYSTVAGRQPIALQQGNAILFSGGMGSTDGLKPIWSGYISKTFFLGATNKTGGVNYTGTYVTEAEIKSTNGITVGTATNSGGEGSPDMSARWFYCLIPETDDGERGLPIYTSPAYFDSAASSFTFPITIDFAQLNKRLRYLNVFAGKATNNTDSTIAWTNLFYINRHDLLGSDFTWIETSGSTAGKYSVTETVSTAIWNNRSQENLFLHLGHLLCTSTTASFSVGVFANNRLFIAKYYDYVDASEHLDDIRYTDFAGNGSAQLNVLCNLDGSTQSTIEQGDSTSVQMLKRWQDKLFILKDNSCYYIPISNDVTEWMLITVSNEIGCSYPDTVTVLPSMITWCQGGESVYGWSGDNIFHLSENWLATFRVLTLTATSKGWYDNKNKTYNFSISSSADNWYSMFLECPIPNGYIWGENFFDDDTVAGQYNIVDVSSRAGTVYVVIVDTNTSAYATIYFDSTATTDNSHFGIIPYFKTAEFRLSERDITKFLKWYLALTPTGGSGTLDCKLTIDSTTTTYSNMTKTNTLHAKGVPFTGCAGRSVQFEFNTNATRAIFTGFDVYDFQFDYEMVPFIGDATITT